jgi:hypothetical protein
MTRLKRPVVRATTRSYRVLSARLMPLVVRLNPDDTISIKELRRRGWLTISLTAVAIRAAEHAHNLKNHYKT